MPSRMILVVALSLAILPGCGTLTVTRYYLPGHEIVVKRHNQFNRHTLRNLIHSYQWKK